MNETNTKRATQTAALAVVTTELATCDARIAHLDWWIATAPAGVDRSWAVAERTLLRAQTRGNLLVDLRAVLAVAL